MENKASQIKSLLRQQFKQKLQEISPERRKSAKQAAFEKIYHRIASSEAVLSFASLPQEIDLWELNCVLAKEKRLILPKVFGGALKFFKVITPEEQLQLSSWKIFEPIPEKCLEKKSVDIVLVPALAFDSHNNRLGRGGGFYDRLLAKKTYKTSIGIGFIEQLSEKPLPSEPFDVKLDDIMLF